MDATAIAVSLIRNDLETASSVMFMLGIGELLEEWTHKKSVGDLARSMSLNVNQASLTGESSALHRERDGYVYAGSIVEEGELTIRVDAVSGSTRYEKIVRMIEESEKLKSGAESKAEHLADKLVPYTLAERLRILQFLQMIFTNL